ncbi:hypothetical protein C8R48DRAFT_691441 [Suillus tomentosus]|nr:hypothetical protein C8R48DRAFT_691441 [Suillus tomentosus]
MLKVSSSGPYPNLRVTAACVFVVVLCCCISGACFLHPGPSTSNSVLIAPETSHVHSNSGTTIFLCLQRAV